MVIVKTRYGYLSGFEADTKPSPGVRAIFDKNRDNAITFENEKEVKKFYRDNGWRDDLIGELITVD